VLFVLTFVTEIPAALLYGPVLDPGYITGDGADNRVFLGASLELLLIIAKIGTAVVLFPILKRQNEILALGYVTARVVECVFIAAGSAPSRQAPRGRSSRHSRRSLGRRRLASTSSSTQRPARGGSAAGSLGVYCTRAREGRARRCEQWSMLHDRGRP
jgi:hypothetical protein